MRLARARSARARLLRIVARFNRYVTNRVTGSFAGRLPGFAIVTHVGRRSGRTYRTPINIFRNGGEYVIALTYGADAEWVKNVTAAGGCELEVGGRSIRVAHPRVFTDPSRRRVPLPVRLGLRLLGVKEFMSLRPS